MKFRCSGCADIFDKCNIECPRCKKLINCHDIIKGVDRVKNER